MSISLSDSAAARVNTFLANRGKGFGLRLGVRTSGCSGMAYVLEFVDAPTEEDTVFEDKGVKVVVDGKSLQFLDGTQLDFVKEGLNEGLNSPTLTSKTSAVAAKASTSDRLPIDPTAACCAWGLLRLHTRNCYGLLHPLWVAGPIPA